MLCVPEVQPSLCITEQAVLCPPASLGDSFLKVPGSGRLLSVHRCLQQA